MLSLKTFLREKIPTARVTGDEEDFSLECNQPVSDADIERWLNEFYEKTGLQKMIDDESPDSCNLTNNKKEWYVLVVSNYSGIPSNGQIIASLFQMR